MKKLLLSLFVAGFATLASAQTRNIDWSTDSIAGMEEIRSSSTGTAFELDFTMKNLGPDTVMVGDTILYQMAIVNKANNQLLISYPDAQSLRIVRPSRMIVPGDTAHVAVNLTTSASINFSANVDVIVISHVVNRPALGFETAPNNTNNSKAKTAVWFNEWGWAVGMKEELDGLKFNVYPNPSSDVVNFETEYTKASKIEVMDITGRLVETVDFTLGVSSVNVSSFNKGIYFYNVINTENKAVKSGKFTVN